MRYTPLLAAAWLAIGIFSAQGALGQSAPTPASTHIIISPSPGATIAAPPVVPAKPATDWANAGQHQFGPTYEMYVPQEIKSNNPEVERSWTAAGAPLNGSGQTEAGQACMKDTDCASPLACFKRADSGQIPVRECALPPGR